MKHTLHIILRLLRHLRVQSKFKLNKHDCIDHPSRQIFGVPSSPAYQRHNFKGLGDARERKKQKAKRRWFVKYSN